MKKLTAVLTCLLILCGLSSHAQEKVNVRLNIDDATHVTVSVEGETLTLNSGENNVQVDNYASIVISPVAPWALKEVFNNASGYPMSIYGTCTVYASEGADFTVTTYDIEATRTASATISVDDASQVRIQRSSDYTTVTLENGDNTFKFNPETEAQIKIASSNYGALYEVLLDGEPVEASYATYIVNLTDGCTVKITAIVPDKDVTVSITYGENAEGAISGASVNSEAVSGFDGKTVAMKAGQQLKLEFSDAYKLESFSVNGTATQVYSYWEQTIMNDTEIHIEARPYDKVHATVIIETPEAITFGSGYNTSAYNFKAIELTGTETAIEVPETNTQVCWSAKSGYYIEKVEVNGQTLESYYEQTYVSEGDVIKFHVGKISYDKTLIVWIDKKEIADQYFSLSGYDRSEITITNGYNEVTFHNGMLPLGLAWHTENPIVGKVYYNGLQMRPLYEESDNYAIHAEDGDVVKIFFAAEPVECAVTFEVEEGLSFSAKADRVTAVEDLSAPLTVFAGTELALLHASDDEITVTANETELTPGEDGLYNLTVTEPTVIKAAAKDQDGIREVSAAEGTEGAIFDLQGRRVGKSAKGLLIINGKKTLVR